MDDFSPILVAALTGFISGLLNLTIINEGARRGFKWALLIGLGATVMEVIYCFIAFTGFASFFSRGYVKAAMELFSFVFMLFLGVKFLVAQSVVSPVHLSARADRLEERLEERLHPHSAFMTGLARSCPSPVGVCAGRAKRRLSNAHIPGRRDAARRCHVPAG